MHYIFSSIHKSCHSGIFIRFDWIQANLAFENVAQQKRSNGNELHGEREK